MWIEEGKVKCPCQGEIQDCELCEGSGAVIADRPTTVTGPMKALVLEARYNAGLPLWNDGDALNPDWKRRRIHAIATLVERNLWRDSIKKGPGFYHPEEIEVGVIDLEELDEEF
jgi:hypothetical protein